jgi:L,D-peptidoglycan transpeptidase YkuD (ErfK/YbiS/YcfS/YnhG family)
MEKAFVVFLALALIAIFSSLGFAADIAPDYLAEIAGDAEWIITAFSDGGKNTAIVTAYELEGGVWTLRYQTKGYFGKNGVSANKREGDGSTPSGVYTFGRAFGVAADPGAATPYTKVTDDDVWVDDPKSKYYNQWAQKSYPDADWRSAEQLAKYDKAYKYAIAINYNTDPVTPGLGSAIFLHCSTGRPTAGCVSVPEDAMKFLLKFTRGAKIAIANSPNDLQTGVPR